MLHQTQVLPTHTATLLAAAVAQAAARLRAGELVALPTETVYGLAANALNEQAVARIFEAKGRPATNPIIVHVDGLDMARRCVDAWPEAADRLARAFWPGPLTLVLPKSSAIPGILTAGGGTVGVRWPSHPCMRAVIRACGFPLAAPSANLSSQVSPTTASHVLKTLDGRISLIVDGGECQVGIESAVLDLTLNPPRVLRPGMIHETSLLAVLGTIRLRATGDRAGGPEGIAEPAPGLRSPGLLPKHYAPKARLAVLAWKDDAELAARLAESAVPGLSVHVIAHTHIPSGGTLGRVAVIPHDPEAYARALYAELHRCDDDGAAFIVVEAPPDAPEWRAIADRLRRAAG